jgi:hypothetical protein
MAVDPTLPPSIATELADLKRRLDNLERSPSLPVSSTRGGVFVFLDNDGVVRAAEGNVNDAGQPVAGAAYGFFLYGDTGTLLVAQKTGDKGITFPNQKISFHDPLNPLVTSGTFVTLWEDYVSQPAHEVVYIEISAFTDVGTTGEIRLIDNLTNTVTSVASYPSGTNKQTNFEWIHPAGVGAFATRNQGPGAVSTAALQLAIQARRTGGAGNFGVHPPRIQELTSKTLHPNANVNGNPVVS